MPPLILFMSSAALSRIMQDGIKKKRACQRDSVKSVYEQKRYFPFCSIFLEKEWNKSGTRPLFLWNVAFSLFITVRQTALIFINAPRLQFIFRPSHPRVSESFLRHMMCCTFTTRSFGPKDFSDSGNVAKSFLWHKRKDGRLNRDEAARADENT